MSDEAIARLRKARRLEDVQRADLRALLEAYDAARAQGAAEERARVVAWLRSPDHLLGTPPTTRDLYIAGAIERGEHEGVK